jgi:hypothetical protein
MNALTVWWTALEPMAQWFFAAAAFFTVFFLIQLVMALVGLGGGEGDLDAHVEPAFAHDSLHDAQDSVTAFKLLSVRSVLAFFTLFTWAGGLYMSRGVPVARALIYALGWGVLAMVLLSVLMHLLRRMAETGTMRLGACVGNSGTVYLDVPAGGTGEVRVMCDGVLSVLKARAKGGGALLSGTPVRMVRVLGGNVIEIEPEQTAATGKGATT